MSEEILIVPKKRGRKPTGRKSISVGMGISKEIYKKAEKVAQIFTRKDEFGRVYSVQDIIRRGFISYLDTFKFDDMEVESSEKDEGQLSFIAL
jgi:hypothetical protein